MYKKLNIIVYESVEHFVPTGFGWLEGFDDLGHETSLLPTKYDINDIDQHVDVLVISDINERLVPTIIKFKDSHPECKIVIMCFKFQEYYLKLKDHVALWVELVCEHDLTKQKFAYHNLPLLFVPLAASTRLFYKAQDAIKYDISFIGQFGDHGHGYRQQDKYLFPLIDKKLKGFFAGFSYNGITYPPVRHSELNMVYNRTAVNLNFHYDFQKAQSEYDELYRLDFNGRVFEIAMSGNFQVCDHPLIPEYFGDSILCATKEDWTDIVQYYIEHEQERTQKAYEAREICLSNHTWKHRMKLVLDKLYDGRN